MLHFETHSLWRFKHYSPNGIHSKYTGICPFFVF